MSTLANSASSSEFIVNDSSLSSVIAESIVVVATSTLLSLVMIAEVLLLVLVDAVVMIFRMLVFPFTFELGWWWEVVLEEELEVLRDPTMSCLAFGMGWASLDDGWSLVEKLSGRGGGGLTSTRDVLFLLRFIDELALVDTVVKEFALVIEAEAGSMGSWNSGLR
jgi:hypothetical protein